MNIAQYARVSLEAQDSEDRASITQQLTAMDDLCERNQWQVIDVFIDKENYKATQSPKKGKSVNPSGERADRPAFTSMLETIKSGTVDIVLCWRDDRLVRHPRVAVALEDALDIGDSNRTNKPKIEIRDATGAMIDRFTLSIKATIWREENKRRAERAMMGKMATLEQGYWPGSYWRFGYKTRRGPRGRIIELEEDEVPVVLKIFEMYDSGQGVRDVRRYLMSNDISQKLNRSRKYEWNLPVIYRILKSKDYTGTATWDFGDGTSMSIEIPAIISLDRWERVQARMKRNTWLSTRNAKFTYLLQGLLHCGDCGRMMHVRKLRFYYKNGEKKEFQALIYEYQCSKPQQLPDVPHPRPFSRYGRTLDWEVWRRLVDYGINQPDFITDYILDRRAELQAQGDDVDGDIAHARHRSTEIDQERAFYQRQAARGKMTEAEFDARMEETKETLGYWESEIIRLHDLRDNVAKVQAGIEYINQLLASIQTILPEVDIPPNELKVMSMEKREEVMKVRQEIVRALVEKVTVWANGQVKIEGALDGSEARQFELGSS